MRHSRGATRTRRRTARAVILALLVAIVAGPLGAPVGAQDPAAFGAVDAQGYRVALPAVLSRYEVIPPHHLGAQVYGSLADEAISHGALRHARTSWLRWELGWASVEPVETDPPTYNWAHVDEAVRTADAMGIRLIITIVTNPAWASMESPTGGGVYRNGPIKEGYVDRFAAFMKALAERYDGDGVDDAPGSPIVTHFELYNEPDGAREDLALFYGTAYWGPFAERYVAMLKRVHPAVKEANPQAQILLGGLAHDHYVQCTDSSDGRVCSGGFSPTFLDEVLAAGGGPFFDVMNFHYYPLFGPAWEDRADGADIIAKANYLRGQLAAYGLDKPIVCTEVGVPSVPEPGICPACNRHVQARYVAQTAVRSMAAGLDIVVWFTWKDLAAEYGGQTALHLHGLIEDDLQPKPSAEAFRTATRMLEGATFVSTERDDDAVEVYRFTRADGTPMYALWATSSLLVAGGDPDPVAVTLPLSSATITDMYGQVTRVAGSGGRVEVEARADPVFVY